MPSHPPNPRPTIQDVAAALGMAKSTVSKGLSGQGALAPATRERILAAARDMGYQPNPVAQRLARRGNNKLVYICSSALDVGIGTTKVLSIQKRLKRLGLEVPLYLVADDDTEGAQAEEMRDLCRQQPRAIVYSTLGWHSAVLAELQNYQESGGIVVCFDAPVPLACDQVVFDRENNTYQAARYLIERGHRKIGINVSHLTEGADLATEQQRNPRLTGFRRALEEAGLEMNEDWLFKPGGYERGGAEMAARFLALKERPTGLCVLNDYSALAFMSEIMAAGVRIPGDLSLVGHDNQLVTQYCPVPLTSAVHPVEQIIEAVVDLLEARLGGSQDEPRTVTLRGQMVERESVSVPAGE